MAEPDRPEQANEAPRCCCDPRQLAAFDRGLLDAPQAARLADQAVRCPRCGGQADSDVPWDDLLAPLVTTRSPYLDEASFRETVRHLLQNPEACPPSWLDALPLETSAAAGPVPSRIDAYRIGELLGRGAMGVVYRAEHVNLKTTVALKILPQERTQSADAVERFYREMRALGKLRSPHIVQALDAGFAHGHHFLAMEYVDGVTAAQLVDADGPLPVPDACDMICQAARGLHAAHRHGMVHRDIKPSNLMVTRKGRVKILDLGLAWMQADMQARGSDRPVGTPEYMAPEQWMSPRVVDIRADLYSLGCTLFRLLAGTPPFRGSGEGYAELRNAHLHTPPPSLRELRPDVPAEVAGVVERLLAKRPDDRFASPIELYAALKPFCRASRLAARVGRLRPTPTGDTRWKWTDELTQPAPLGSAVLPALPTRTQRPTRRRWHVVYAAVVIAVLLVPTTVLMVRWTPILGRLLGIADGSVTVRNGASGEQQPGIGDRPRAASGRRSGAAPSAVINTGRGEVTSVVLLPNSPLAVTGHKGGYAALWDLAASQELLNLAGHTDTVFATDVDPTGEKIATGGMDGQILVWNRSGELLHRLAGDGEAVMCVRFSHDGRRLATGGFDGLVRLWDVETGKPLGTLAGHGSWVRGISFSRDDRRLASCGNDAVAIVWDLEQARMRRLLVGHRAPVSSIELSADGQLALTGSFDHTARVWNVERETALQVLRGHQQAVRRAHWLVDPPYVLTASEDGTLRIRNWTNGTALDVLHGHEGLIHDAAIDRARQKIISAGADETLRRWDIPRLPEVGGETPFGEAPLAPERPLPADVVRFEPRGEWLASNQPLRAVAIAADRSQLAVGGTDGVLRLLKTARTSPPSTDGDAHLEPSMDEKPDESLTALAGQGARWVWDERDAHSLPDEVLDLAFSPTGTLLAAGSKDANIYLMPPEAPQEVHVLRGHTSWITSLAFTDRPGILVSASLDGTVKEWNTHERTAGATLEGHRYWVLAVVHVPKPDAHEIVSGGTEGALLRWNLDRHQPIEFLGEPFTWHVAGCIAASRGGGHIAAAGWADSIRVWQLGESEPLYEIPGQQQPIHCLAVSPQADYVLAGSADGQLRLWHGSSSQLVRVVQAHRGAVRDMVVDWDAGEVLTVGDDGLLRGWQFHLAKE